MWGGQGTGKGSLSQMISVTFKDMDVFSIIITIFLMSLQLTYRVSSWVSGAELGVKNPFCVCVLSPMTNFLWSLLFVLPALPMPTAGLLSEENQSATQME